MTIPEMLGLFRAFWRDRRRQDLPVEHENRGSRRAKIRKADDELMQAVTRFKETVQAHTDDLHHQRVGRYVGQRIVIWSTFWPVCKYNAGGAQKRLCGNPAHSAFGTDDPAYCDEDRCPLLVAVT